jgi:hypothetical protein
MRHFAQDRLQKRTLARAIRTDYGRQLPTMDMDIHMVKDGQPANFDGKIFDPGAA